MACYSLIFIVCPQFCMLQFYHVVRIDDVIFACTEKVLGDCYVDQLSHRLDLISYFKLALILVGYIMDYQESIYSYWSCFILISHFMIHQITLMGSRAQTWVGIGLLFLCLVFDEDVKSCFVYFILFYFERIHICNMYHIYIYIINIQCWKTKARFF